MSIYDVSALSDDQLEERMNALLYNPFTASMMPLEQRQATVAEYNRRLARRAPAPDNVDANLQAAATPVTPDPAVRSKPAATWRDMSDEEMVAPLGNDAGPGGGIGVRASELGEYGQRYRQAVGRTIDRGAARRQAARQAGYQDQEQIEYNRATGLSPEEAGEAVPAPLGSGGTAMIEGVEVPTFQLGDGNWYFTEGDLRRAKEAANEARLSKMFSESAQEDLKNYGDKQMVKYTYDAKNNITGTEYVEPSSLTDAEVQQQNNLRARRNMEMRQQRQNAALRNRPGLRALENAEDARRNRVAAMAMLAGGSQNINSGNRWMFNTLLELPPDERVAAMRQMLPMNPVRAQVEARQLDAAARLAQQVVTGALAGTSAGPLAAAQAEGLGLANDARRAEQRASIENQMADQYAAPGLFGYNEFTLEEQQAAIDTLVNVHGYTLPEAQAAVDRMASGRRATQRLPRQGQAAPAGS